MESRCDRDYVASLFVCPSRSPAVRTVGIEVTK